MDGSNNATRLLDHVIALVRQAHKAQVDVIDVWKALDPPQVQRFWSAENVAEFQLHEGNVLSEPARTRPTDTGNTQLGEAKRC